jgi:hypothetical protein
MISIVYATNRGPYCLTDERLRHLSQYDILSDSLRSQTYRDFELVCVVKGWHGEGVRHELHWLGERVRFVPPKSTPWDKLNAFNASAARNTGLALAHGNVVLFCDDCVTFGPNFLAQIAARATVGQFLVPVYLREGQDPWHWCDPCHFGGIVSVPRLDALEAGGWEERFAGCHSLEDWEFAGRMTRRGLTFVQSDECAIRLEKHKPRSADQLRCNFAVYALLDGQGTANRPWNAEQFKVFDAPACFFCPSDVCLVAFPGSSPVSAVKCLMPARPSAETLTIMREHEGVA